ncbi:hypothetical protein, partial [Staphylococcus aureus]|uniref:hypothetical protein n=1 Tax=Staphylococcus aureus TaxID=1280 RepID=UPI0019D59222
IRTRTILIVMVSTHPAGIQHSGSQYLPDINGKNGKLSPNQQLLPMSARVIVMTAWKLVVVMSQL